MCKCYYKNNDLMVDKSSYVSTYVRTCIYNIYTYILTYSHTDILTYIHTHMHTHTCTHTHRHIRTHTPTHPRIRTRTYTNTHIHTYTFSAISGHSRSSKSEVGQFQYMSKIEIKSINGKYHNAKLTKKRYCTEFKLSCH
jgi:hypothetical protein